MPSSRNEPQPAWWSSCHGSDQPWPLSLCASLALCTRTRKRRRFRPASKAARASSWAANSRISTVPQLCTTRTKRGLAVIWGVGLPMPCRCEFTYSAATPAPTATGTTTAAAMPPIAASGATLLPMAALCAAAKRPPATGPVDESPTSAAISLFFCLQSPSHTQVAMFVSCDLWSKQ